jgi:hypothetical protein
MTFVWHYKPEDRGIDSDEVIGSTLPLEEMRAKKLPEG